MLCGAGSWPARDRDCHTSNQRCRPQSGGHLPDAMPCVFQVNRAPGRLREVPYRLTRPTPSTHPPPSRALSFNHGQDILAEAPSSSQQYVIATTDVRNRLLSAFSPEEVTAIYWWKSVSPTHPSRPRTSPVPHTSGCGGVGGCDAGPRAGPTRPHGCTGSSRFVVARHTKHEGGLHGRRRSCGCLCDAAIPSITEIRRLPVDASSSSASSFVATAETWPGRFSQCKWQAGLRKVRSG